MSPYDWVATLFGISGWIVAALLWSRLSSLHTRRRTHAGHTATLSPAAQRELVPRTVTASPTVRQRPLLEVKKESDGIWWFRFRDRPLAYLTVVAAILLLGWWQFGHSWTTSSKTPRALDGPAVIIRDISFIKVEHRPDSGLDEPPYWRTKSVQVVDSAGNPIEFSIGVLWDPYRWVKGDVHTVAIDQDERVRHPIENVIRNFRNDETRPIIVVGMASHENAEENPEQEIRRAGNRADKLVAAVTTHFVKHPRIYSLNLGAYRPDRHPSRFSASERRVVLLVIDRGENSPDLTAAVKKALVKAGIDKTFVFDARDYSLFDTERFNLVLRSS